MKGAAGLLAIALVLMGCDDKKVEPLCIVGTVSADPNMIDLAAALMVEGRRLVALDLALSSAIQTRKCDGISACTEMDVPSSGRTGPSNLYLRVDESLHDRTTRSIEGVFLSRLDDITDSTRIIELSKIASSFPSSIERAWCRRIGVAR